MQRRYATPAIAALVAALVMRTAGAQAQPPSRIHRVAVVEYLTEAAVRLVKDLVLRELNKLGYVERRNLVLEIRSLLGMDPKEQEAVMADVVRTRPDVIVVAGTNAALRAVKATRSIPVVMWASVDPVAAGLAQSLAHPGGNVTGLVSDVGAGAEEKRMQLLLELVPRARRIAFVGVQPDWTNPWGAAVRSFAAKRGVVLVFAEGTGTSDFSRSVEIVRKEKPDAVFVALSGATSQARALFGRMTVETGIPSVCGIAEMANDACVMTYGQSSVEFIARSMAYVDRILKGANAADLPIEQPTRFQLVINLKLANQIGLQVPSTLLMRADKVVE
ncbi:ABC transporter substrate-binding protein [Ramlibacter albus]|uniref:ABC transporter substrate-binding protein n=1 Tax=Ramlibacter albus TaxID=2079448 RepID=A0A923S528_9BURK|nr:ABC transporter substrate-binding protein [Ramlibacter albus]MBC5768229.1 ABC transporter substrate-binding protein [Ramlibacter albus]